MQQLALPVRHEWLARERGYGKIAMEPFEPGLALTIGNAYRRVLLSSIPGAAPTWAKIEGVLHEFSHLQGVNEDTLDIITNLRKLVFVLHVNRPKLLRLRAQGPSTVTAGDFDPDADVEILTPEVALATLDKLGEQPAPFSAGGIVGYVVRNDGESDDPTDGPVIAMSAACTHMGCLVNWENSDRKFRSSYVFDTNMWFQFLKNTSILSRKLRMGKQL